MIRAAIVQAEGSPCPTAVLPLAAAPPEAGGLLSWLAEVRRWMRGAGLGPVLKLALAEPKGRNELDYRFVQVVPGARDAFELRGTCGHSILAAVLGAEALGWTDAGAAVRVAVRGNGDIVHCEPSGRGAGAATYAVRFTAAAPKPLRALTLFDEPSTMLDVPGGRAEVSGVDAGNPYVFVDAARLGADSAAALFTAGDDLYRRMAAIRDAAERRLGWRPGTFPKIAAVAPGPDGAVAARAISVPSWHPTLALTGAISLAAACAIPGTVPSRRLRGGPRDGELTILTPGGATSATAVVAHGRLLGVGIGNKAVRLIDLVDIPIHSGPDRPLAALTVSERTP
ncbi:PrpF domain-containing protein [Glycomyces tritici]|uniref:PrpF domain-containing protein n=1 Tax=Glycomyces tritici TaxID=2665176 RepID=A0ABT7YNB8_9ACTN|nr:PrpF domain-containing protein [Glycomyces tritici]MDN3240113.1 PrpF domain-containing protein [Glycomyces tritici]